MSEPRERELKYRILSRDGYERLMTDERIGGRGTLALQKNYYFDAEGVVLARAGAILRLRDARALVLTFKQGGERKGQAGYFDAIEVEAAFPRERLPLVVADPARLIDEDLPPVERVRERFGALKLLIVARLQNERCRVEGEYPLEIDRLEYPDGTERYEIEIETDDAEGARRWLEELLEARQISAEPQHRTKLQEFLDRHEEGGTGHGTIGA